MCQHYILPKRDSLRKVIQRKRKDGDMPSVSRALENLIIPQAYQQIETDGHIEQFLLYDSVNIFVPQRIFIFSTQERLLCASENWFFDGTFSTAQVFLSRYILYMLGSSIPC